jgi:hypothetical protein
MQQASMGVDMWRAGKSGGKEYMEDEWNWGRERKR